MVVGANSNPAITPQRYDCGLENTTLYGFKMLDAEDAASSDRCSLGVITTRSSATINTTRPLKYQNAGTVVTPLIRGPTPICPAEPPSIPKHCVTPIAVASRCAGRPWAAR